MKSLFFGIAIIAVILLIFGCTQQTQNVINNAVDGNAGNNSGDINSATSLCGNSLIDAGETCSTCAKDAKCAEGEICKTGKCEKNLEAKNITGKIGEEFELTQGSTANIAEKSLSIKFIGILVVDGEDGIIQKARLEIKTTTTKTIDLEAGKSQEIEAIALKAIQVNSETKKVKLILQTKESFCGNNSAETWETCSSCASDVKCSATQECSAGVCVNKCKFACCSVTDCNDDNNSTTDKCLSADTNSARCENTSAGGTKTGNYVNITTPNITKNYYQGDMFGVNGKGDFADSVLNVKFIGLTISSENGAPSALFSLIKGGATITSQTVDQGTNIQFFDDNGNEILADTISLNLIVKIIG